MELLHNFTNSLSIIFFLGLWNQNCGVGEERMAVVSHFIDKEFKVGLKVLLSVSFRL